MHWRPHGRSVLVVLGLVNAVPVVLSAQTMTTQALSFSALRPLAEVPAAVRRGDLLEHPFTVSRRQPGRDLEIDLAPVLDGILGFLHAYGIPLRQDRALAGKHGVVFSAAWSVGQDNEPVRFHIGDRGPLDAFYANEGGFRAALAWPITRELVLQLEGGEDSEFGNWAIGGVQWRHPSLPLVIGVGVPLALNNASGDVGVLCQLRMLLE